ncbi:phosphoenolpyruvate--protein phosphotransferase [Halohasta litorea]|uniref:Phosphoenolpyruvate-protein phosphotransferase n=1 Tax=Halohasta litorea TaxID=869891 RepID=A0ABD6D991_9EURY|nr:phosphoenolpyruvate--protein phosphotransferase [Halohasta litorea]
MTERRYEGIGATPTVGIGTATWYRPTDVTDLDEPPAAEDVDAAAERERFDEAQADARAELEAERESTRERVGDDEAAVFDAHLKFLEDPQIESGVEAALDDGLPAPHAVMEAFEGPIEQFEGMDGMMAERADDLRDIRDRLLRLLTGTERTDLGSLPDGSVVLAEMLTPSDTAQLDPEAITGIATSKGGRTAHAAIIARSLGIPAVVGIGDELDAIEDGQQVVVDGEAGVVIAEPDEETRQRAAESTQTPVVEESVATADGREIEVAANLGTPVEAEPAVDRGADGVGLFRTEFLFQDRSAAPDEDEQYDAYHEVCETFAAGLTGEEPRIVVRTLDVGGDKPIDYLDLDPEENGFLGARGIRLSLEEHADLFETQLRALLRVAATDAGAGLAVMFPLVSTVEELEAALEQVEQVADDLESEGVEYAIPELGVMVETPASTYLADAFAERVDFLSIGTNDLTQYIQSAQRDLDRMTDYQDPLAPAVVRAIDRTVTAGHAGGAWVGMCGEMAGDPELTELLVGLGLDELSMSAVTIPDVKTAIQEVDTEAADALAESVLAADTLAEVQDCL